jgi:hypothetical protein
MNIAFSSLIDTLFSWKVVPLRYSPVKMQAQAVAKSFFPAHPPKKEEKWGQPVQGLPPLRTLI